MNLIKRFLTKNPCYVANVQKADSRYILFQRRGPLGLMLHSVGCAQPSAMVFVTGWDKPSYDRACVHGFIDANTGTVYQTLPWNYRGWHGGGSSNNTHCGVEMCESAYIRYLQPGESGYSPGKFVIRDKSKAQADATRAYNAAVELFASICKEYNLDPLTKICSHKEGHDMGIATNHGDPEHYWKGLGMSYTMAGFRAAVKAELDKLNTPQTPEHQPPKEEDITDMTKEEIKAMINEAVETRFSEYLGKYIEEAKDIPHEGVRTEMRELLDKEIINGGTPSSENPDDIFLPYNIVRALVVAKRYVDAKIAAAKITSEL